MTASVPRRGVGFAPRQETLETMLLSFDTLRAVYGDAPGLVVDKLKAVLLYAWEHIQHRDRHRIVFAYDEAQNLADHAARHEFPLSVLLDVFQSIQRQGVPFMLVLTGLPTLFPKLVDARTYAERMFHILTLDRLTDPESRDAITKPLQGNDEPLGFSRESVDVIVNRAAGYPYFVQFICKEVYDIFLQQIAENGQATGVPFDALQQKLDTDFFSGRWSKISDRQREMLWTIASFETDGEFTIQEIVEASKRSSIKAFSGSQTNQMLSRLSDQGLIYKNRFGKYLFAVPLFGDFIRRTFRPTSEPLTLYEPLSNAALP